MTKKQLKDKAERKRLRDDDKLKEYAAKIVLDKISIIPVYVMLETYGWKISGWHGLFKSTAS